MREIDKISRATWDRSLTQEFRPSIRIARFIRSASFHLSTDPSPLRMAPATVPIRGRLEKTGAAGLILNLGAPQEL
jgi:hypothetical protein